jgi:hypothetical protein
MVPMTVLILVALILVMMMLTHAKQKVSPMG